LSLGVFTKLLSRLQAYNLLASIGNLKKSDHEEFRKKHGFAFQSQQSKKPPPSDAGSFG